MSEYRECPFCAEQILIKAKKCKHCQSMIDEQEDVKPPKKTDDKIKEEKPVEAVAPPPVSKTPPPPPAPPSSITIPPPSASPAYSGGAKSSPLKTVFIVLGSIVGLLILAFIFLVIYGLANPGALEVERIATALSVDADGRAVDPTDTFYPDSGSIYVTVELSKVPADTVLSFKWYFLDADYLIDSYNLNLPRGAKYANSWLPLDEWPDGAYQVDVSVDEEIIASTKFTVVIETGTIPYQFEGDQGEYRGQLLSGIPHGQGYWEGRIDGSYDGEWAFGLPHGFGFFDSSTAAYEGYWLNGNPHGEGVLVMYNEFVFTGNFKEGNPHGVGNILFEDGTVIEGEWFEGELQD